MKTFMSNLFRFAKLDSKVNTHFDAGINNHVVYKSIFNKRIDLTKTIQPRMTSQHNCLVFVNRKTVTSLVKTINYGTRQVSES